MTTRGVKSPYLRGVIDGLPFLAVIAPFGLLFGVISAEAGLSVLDAVAFSVAVIAGAAQFTALHLMTDHAPTIVVLVSALAVNLRMAMYSASITPHLGHLPVWKRALTAYFLVDQTYALSSLEFERREMGVGEKFSYFLGTVTPICLPWYLFTLAGAWAGAAIPTDMGLDFAVPVAFLAMIGPMLRTPAHIAAALVAAGVSLAFAWLPYNLGLIVGGIAGMMTGAQVELVIERRAAPEEAA
ncbi:AzlC family ABC transporter permease [Roseivivax sediminis]|uniref:Predicted branched-chain amino acid permease (Azaleucine resistance) n=1 Tax=Roseivivax sediminis TaxID=936889 RepID=A0A1I2DT76_9RHOB|nr:AzlC family ABC transporter permease [Roseivivax sediminis]SFE83598.1 Predicted branched-chain amino acid permease (azaleucine resistance) [Roseivivax sediminis]